MRRFKTVHKMGFALLLLAVAGCEPHNPPSPAALKLIKAQTLIGPVKTKVRAKPFTYPVKAGEQSFWDIKVFDIKDKPDGLRQEWKHYAQLPQQPDTKINNTQVLMNGWIISKDGTVFLPQKPTYKQYGSFYTDWTLPRPGDYTLWLEYQPAVAQNEDLSMGELMTRRASYNLPREVGYWNFTAIGKVAPIPDMSKYISVLPTPPEGSDMAMANNNKGQATLQVVFFSGLKTQGMSRPEAKVGQKTKLQWGLSDKSSIENPEIVAIAPDNSTLVHGIGSAPEMTFDVPGEWKIWFNYTRGEQSFAAPYVLKVAAK